MPFILFMKDTYLTSSRSGNRRKEHGNVRRQRQPIYYGVYSSF